MMIEEITKETIDVTPNTIDVYEIEEFTTTGQFFSLKPLYYTCIITLSPKVITDMLRWAHTYGFIKIEGNIAICINRSRRVLNDHS